MGNEVMIKKRKIVGVLNRVKRYPHHSTILTPIETSSVTGSTNFRHVFAVKLKSFVISKSFISKREDLASLVVVFHAHEAGLPIHFSFISFTFLHTK